jgi:exodeoxyribonuclease VII small subunit
MAKKAPAADGAAPPSFEQALAQLEEIVEKLEDGQLGLEEALQCYEQGVGLLKQCHGLLEAAEKRVLLLTGTDAEGQATTEPFPCDP